MQFMINPDEYSFFISPSMTKETLWSNLDFLHNDESAWNLLKDPIPLALLTKTDLKAMVASMPGGSCDSMQMKAICDRVNVLDFVIDKKTDEEEVFHSVKWWSDLCALYDCQSDSFPDSNEAVSSICTMCKSTKCKNLPVTFSYLLTRDDLEGLLHLRARLNKLSEYHQAIEDDEMYNSSEKMRAEGKRGEFAASALEITLEDWGVLKETEAQEVKKMLSDPDPNTLTQTDLETRWMALEIALAKLRVLAKRKQFIKFEKKFVDPESDIEPVPEGIDEESKSVRRVPITAEDAYVFGVIDNVKNQLHEIELCYPTIHNLLCQTKVFTLLEASTHEGSCFSNCIIAVCKVVNHLAFQTKLHINATQLNVKRWLKGDRTEFSRDWLSWKFFGLDQCDFDKLGMVKSREAVKKTSKNKRKLEDDVLSHEKSARVD